MERPCVAQSCEVLDHLKDIFYRLCKVCNDSQQLEHKTAAKLETEKDNGNRGCNINSRH